ncbi:hypothetical protein P7F60_28620 [Rhizobium sp. YJ-22]|uniref:hypothetical protein n=1 Tax=Rhizobium sp. YJ-22 TaxID=3037556 RepID=UPI001AC079D9|nr:hypothetical protein [Rhizobium sp. YJ-22]MBN9032291.1 hypothetical protein [Hyphomicrobiales bacterium]MDG3580347.1 hypothetical protein [Rhizobium sp. YJ-22]
MEKTFRLSCLSLRFVALLLLGRAGGPVNAARLRHPVTGAKTFREHRPGFFRDAAQFAEWTVDPALSVCIVAHENHAVRVWWNW